MGTQEIIALVRARAAELVERGKSKGQSLTGVNNEANETKEQRRVRHSAQCDWDTAAELNTLVEQIESTTTENPA